MSNLINFEIIFEFFTIKSYKKIYSYKNQNLIYVIQNENKVYILSIYIHNLFLNSTIQNW